MKAILNFKSGAKIVIDLIQTPIVDLWKEAHLENLKRGNRPVGTLSCVGINNTTFEDQFKDNIEELNSDIDKINQGIQLANEAITGDKFPYIAFYQMPWMQVNRIHRCYTTASVKKGIWFHNLNAVQLIQCKKEQYISRFSFFKDIPNSYTVLDEQKFFNGIELINKHIHLYERFLHTQRSIDFHKYHQTVIDKNPPIEENYNSVSEYIGNTSSIYTDFNWDSFDQFGGKLDVFTHRTSYDQIKESTPDDWDTYDVFLNKCIAGKDYEHAYFNYDDPLEADITNVDGIDGGMRLHYDKNLTSFYNYEPFVRWYREKDIEHEMVRPIPLGRINREESSNKLYNIQLLDHGTCTTSGYPKLVPPFDEPVGIEFI